MKNKNYNQIVEKLGREKLDFLSDKFGEVRERYLMYLVTGVEHENSVENALFDVFEGDDDVQDLYPKIEDDKDVIAFFCIVSSFGSFEEFHLIYTDETVRNNM